MRRGPSYNPIPLYLRIASSLRSRIGTIWTLGSRLPAEPALAAEFQVTISTIRRAVDILETEGLVARYQGKGTDVVKVPEGVDQQLTGSMDDLLSFKPEVKVKIVRRVAVVPPVDVRRILRLSDSDKRVHLQRIASLDGAPVAFTDSFVPIEYDRVFSDKELKSHTLISLTWTKCGVRFSRADQSISAAMASPAIARALKVALAYPLIVLGRTDYDASGQPVLYTTCQYRADRYRIEVSLAPADTRLKTRARGATRGSASKST